MTRAEAKRAAYELIANEVEALIDRHTVETWWSDDDWNAVLDELRRLHDKFQMKADPNRVIPSMRLDELEQLGGHAEPATEEPERTLTAVEDHAIREPWSDPNDEVTGADWPTTDAEKVTADVDAKTAEAEEL